MNQMFTEIGKGSKLSAKKSQIFATMPPPPPPPPLQ